MIHKSTKRQVRAVALAALLVVSLASAGAIAGASATSDLTNTPSESLPADTFNSEVTDSSITESTSSTITAATNNSTDYIFRDDFEDEPADAGIPQDWESRSQWNATEVAVSTANAENGSQSFYANESESSNVVYIAPQEQPYSQPQTGNVSAALYQTTANYDPGPDDTTSLRLYEDQDAMTIVRLNETGLEYIDASGNAQTISTVPTEGEWVNVTIFGINTGTRNFSVSWSTANDSGVATGLELQNETDRGFTSTYIGIDDEGYADDFRIESGDHVSGRVTTCPVSNPVCGNPTGAPDGTIVEYFGVRENNIDPAQGQTLLERAEEIRNQIEQINQTDLGYEENLDLESRFEDTNNNYVAFHTRSDWSLNGGSPTLDSEDGDGPINTLPADQDVIMSVWDPTCGNVIQDGLDKDLYGCEEGGTVEFQQLSPTNEVTDTYTVDTSYTRESASLSGASDHDYGVVNLPTGYYRVSPEGSPYTDIIAVGEPDQQIRAIISDLQDQNETLTQRGQNIIDRSNNGTIVHGTTATYTENGTPGQFNFTVPDDVSEVQVQAYTPAAEDVTISDVQNASFDNLQAFADLETYNESYYITPEPVSVDTPTNDADIRAVQVNSLPFGDIGPSLNNSEWLDRLLQNETLARAVVGQLESVTAMNESEVQAIHDNLSRLAQENEILREQLESRNDIEVTLESGQSTDALRNEITALRQEINQLEGELQAGDGETDVSDGTIDATIPWDGDLDPDAVAVTANNIQTGETTTVSDQYWSVNKRTGRTDQVLIEGYPIANDTAQITFGVTVVGEDGTSMGDTRVNARNPAYSGQFVSVDAVDVSAIAPGPSQEIAVEPDLDEDSPDVQNVTATVYGPTGERPITHDGETIRFDTNGSGAYNIQLQITDTNGQQWTEMVSIEAQNETVTRPPSIRAMDGFTGDVALVGAGLTSGEINTDGSTLSVAAVAPTDNTPSELHVFTESLSNSHDETTVRLLEETSSGEPEQARTRAKVFVHVAELDDDTILYREGPQPLGYEEQTAYGGAVESDDGDGHTIVTHTEADGTVTVETIQNPGPVASTMWEVRKGAPFTIPRAGALNPLYALFFDTFDFLSDLLGLLLDMVATSPTGGVTAPEPSTVAGPTSGGVEA